MEDVFVYPLKNSNEYNEIINTICTKWSLRYAKATYNLFYI